MMNIVLRDFHSHVHDLYDSILNFFKHKTLNEIVSKDLESRRADVGYLSDIFNKLNEVNIKL